MPENADSSLSSGSIEDTNDFSSVKKQEARAFLRERFLRIITGVIGKKLVSAHLKKE